MFDRSWVSFYDFQVFAIVRKDGGIQERTSAKVETIFDFMHIGCY